MRVANVLAYLGLGDDRIAVSVEIHENLPGDLEIRVKTDPLILGHQFDTCVESKGFTEILHVMRARMEKRWTVDQRVTVETHALDREVRRLNKMAEMFYPPYLRDCRVLVVHDNGVLTLVTPSGATADVGVQWVQPQP